MASFSRKKDVVWPHFLERGGALLPLFLEKSSFLDLSSSEKVHLWPHFPEKERFYDISRKSPFLVSFSPKLPRKGDLFFPKLPRKGGLFFRKEVFL
jgi:hypothetical protein